MKLYFYGFIMLFKKFILRQNTGKVINDFVRKMGVVYIKFAQILAMQNIGNIFTEKDRKELCSICDNCNPIEFSKIKAIIEKEYHCSINKKFKKIYEKPIGSASISQVHKAILKNGDLVAIKIKREDITKKIEHDIKQIKRIIHRFGNTVGFKNLLGGDTALEMYLDWIYEEINFENEKNNLIQYKKFADSVNDKVANTVNIVIPKLYNKLCTNNIIVMEYIDSWTINKIKLTNKNKEKVKNALNDYISLSFYALFNNDFVTFHGDPHGGNIYIDRKGNIGFLDMGLTFNFDKEEIEFIKKLFFSAYFNKYEELTQIVLENGKYQSGNLELLKEEIGQCCKELKNVPVTNFFVNMILIFTKYDISPPKILYKLAKAFVALNGLNDLVDNKIDTEKLLRKQITEYYVNRTINDVEEIVKDGIFIVPNLLINTLKNGLVKGISEEVTYLDKMHKKLSKAVNNCGEIISYFK